MKSFLFIFFLSFQLYSQNNLFRHDQELFSDFGYSNEEILKFKSQGTLSIFNKEKHNTNLADKLFKLNEGKSLVLKGPKKKKLTVLKKKEVEHFRINYIFFDGEKLNYKDIDSLREHILKLSKTKRFEQLAQTYSMDKNKNSGGDSGWFKSRSVPVDFKNAALSGMRAANEIFKVDLETQNWYYLILTSNSPQFIEEILVLKTQE